jgi:hypothetical protein
MTRWVLITGGVASGLGKGCLAAMLCRALKRAHGSVAYRKVEPCLQGDVGRLPNDAFGEIVAGESGEWSDADTARVAFFVGEGADVSDQSLGHALACAAHGVDADADPAPRLLDRVATGMVLTVARERPLVVEVGGTAGELEHRVVVEALLVRLGTPTLHLHVTTWANVGGRTTTKAAEVSLRALALPPDAIFVRHSLGVPASGRLRDAIVVAGDEWPERAWHRALGRLPESLGRRLELSFEQPDPLFESVRSEPVLVRLVTDVSHPDAYASLAMRLRAWSRGGIVLLGPDDVIPAAGEVRIGERAPPSSNAAVLLEIVPTEKGAAPRERAARPPTGTAPPTLRQARSTTSFALCSTSANCHRSHRATPTMRSPRSIARGPPRARSATTRSSIPLSSARSPSGHASRRRGCWTSGAAGAAGRSV